MSLVPSAAGRAGYGVGQIKQSTLGLTNAQDSFEEMFTRHGIPEIDKGKGEIVTPPLEKTLRHPTIQQRWKGWAAAMLGGQKHLVLDNAVEKAKGHVAHWIESKADLFDSGQRKFLLGESKALREKATTDSGTVGIPSVDGAVPLVYDPDIIQILKDSAPILDRINTRGQSGFKAVANRLDARGGPLGFASESTSANMLGETPSSPTYGQTERSMKILLDLVEVTDFAQIATEVQFDLRDSALGAALANLMQLKEQAVLYADPSQGTGSGGLGDTNAYKGLEQDIADNVAGNHIDKSATSIDGTLGLIKDVKSEVKAFLQSNKNVTPADLFIGTSHTVVGQNENEMQTFVRVAQGIDGVNVGGGEVQIHGVPVVPSHNVDAHVDGAYNVGSEGDVFLLNRRSLEFRTLMPMASVPLARRGFADLVAIGEFGSPILRANGHFSKYLSGYPVTALT